MKLKYCSVLLLLCNLFVFSAAFSQSNYQAPTLSIGAGSVTAKKGNLDVELLSKIISEKQREIVREGIKRIVLDHVVKNEKLDNFTQFYIERISNILFEEKNHRIITKRILEESINYLFVVGTAKFSMEQNIIRSKKKFKNLTKSEREALFRLIISICRSIPTINELGILSTFNYYELDKYILDAIGNKEHRTLLSLFLDKQYKKVFEKYSEQANIQKIRNEIKNFNNLFLEAKTLFNIDQKTFWDINRYYYNKELNRIKILISKNNTLFQKLYFVVKDDKNRLQMKIKQVLEKSELLKKIIETTKINTSFSGSFKNLIETFDQHLYSKDIKDLIFTNSNYLETNKYFEQLIKSFKGINEIVIDLKQLASVQKALQEIKKAETIALPNFSETEKILNTHMLSINVLAKYSKTNKQLSLYEQMYERAKSNLSFLSNETIKFAQQIKKTDAFFKDNINLKNGIIYYQSNSGLYDSIQKKYKILESIRAIQNDIAGSKSSKSDSYLNALSNFTAYPVIKKEIEKIKDAKNDTTLNIDTYNQKLVYLLPKLITAYNKIKLTVQNIDIANVKVTNLESYVTELENMQNSFIIEKIQQGKDISSISNIFSEDLKKAIEKLPLNSLKSSSDVKIIEDLYNLFSNKSLDAKIRDLSYLTEIEQLLPKVQILSQRIPKDEESQNLTHQLNKLINSIDLANKVLVKHQTLSFEETLKIPNISSVLDFLKFIGNIKELNKAETFSFLLNTIDDYSFLLDTDKRKIIPDIINAIRNYSVIDLENNLIEMDAASILTHIAEKYKKEQKVQFYVTVGLNQYFDISGNQYDAASEKIGIRISFNKNDKNYKSLYHDIKRKPLISDYYTMLYASGVLYKIAKTTDSRFNNVNIGIAFGLSFYNALDFNLSFALPLNGIKSSFYGISLDVPLSEYLKKL
ncbi:MAG: hypothetical protein ACK5H1_02565 [Tenacibaculum sp.]